MKITGYWLQTAELPVKGKTSGSQDSCIFHTIGRVLNPLTWDLWFPLITNHLLIFRLPVLCCKTSL